MPRTIQSLHRLAGFHDDDQDLGPPCRARRGAAAAARAARGAAGRRRRSPHIARSRGAVQRILAGADDRLLVITGPCSIHEPESALDYAQRLCEFAPRVADALFLVMRVYFEKPRTRLGWKGLIYDPDLDGRGNIRQGLVRRPRPAARMRAARRPRRLGDPRSRDAPVLRRAPRMGGNWRAHDRESAASADGLRAFRAGRLQEPDERKSPAGGRRDHRRCAAAQVPIDFTRRPRDRRHDDRESALSPRAARGPRASQLRRAERERGRRGAGERRLAAAADGRLQPRQQRRRSSPPADRRSGPCRAGRVRLARNLRGHAREPPGRRPAGHSRRPPRPALRTERDRRVHGLGDDDAGPRGSRRRGATAASRPR